MGEQVPYVLNLNGGLDLVSPHYVLQKNPGTARIMINYEPSVSAGYRRINGWSQFGSATPTGADDTILGVFPYADGVVAIAGSGIYFSTDGDTWMQVNRDTYTQQSTGTLTIDGSVNVVKGTEAADLTTLYSIGEDIRINSEIRNIVGITADTITVDQAFATSTSAIHYKNGTDTLSGTILPRVNQGRAMFAWYEEDGEYGSLVWSDESGNYDLGYFKITGSGAGRVYQYDVLDSANFGAPSKPKYITQFEERVVVANDATSTGNVSWSDRLNNRRFTGASAGTLQVDHPVLAVRGLRDRVVVFCRNSIHQLVELDDPNQFNTAILPVTYKVGCASGWTVQEIGGDLIFLAPDGIRTLQAADSYGDVQFGNVARKIDPIVNDILANLNNTTFSSVVLRNKNQYRLFHTRSTLSDSEQPALIGTLKADNTGQVIWQWSKMEGMPIASIDGVTSVSDLSLNLEKHLQGMTNGEIGFHDEGNSFNGGNIQARLELNELDYGDIGRRKTLHYVRIFGDVESPTLDEITMNVVYDYNDLNTAQPPSYPLVGITGVAGYGEALYGQDTYGGAADFSERVLIEGSGYSNRFKFNSFGQEGPYSINSLYIDMRMGPQL